MSSEGEYVIGARVQPLARSRLSSPDAALGRPGALRRREYRIHSRPLGLHASNRLPGHGSCLAGLTFASRPPAGRYGAHKRRDRGATSWRGRIAAARSDTPSTSTLPTPHPGGGPSIGTRDRSSRRAGLYDGVGSRELHASGTTAAVSRCLGRKAPLQAAGCTRRLTVHDVPRSLLGRAPERTSTDEHYMATTHRLAGRGPRRSSGLRARHAHAHGVSVVRMRLLATGGAGNVYFTVEPYVLPATVSFLPRGCVTRPGVFQFHPLLYHRSQELPQARRCARGGVLRSPTARPRIATTR